MRRAIMLFLAGLVGIVPVSRCRGADAAGPTTAPAADEVTALIAKLGDADFRTRRDASTRLRDIGAVALTRLKEACQSPDPEVRSRARELVRELEYHPIPGRPRSGRGRVTAVTLSITNGQRTVNVEDEGRTIRIVQGIDGIEMTVRGELEGHPATETYKARSPEDLKSDNPEAYALYERFAHTSGVEMDANALQQQIMVRGNVLVLPQPAEPPLRLGGDDLTALREKLDEQMTNAGLTRTQRRRVHDAVDDVEQARQFAGGFQLDDPDHSIERYNQCCDRLRKVLGDLHLPDPGDALPPPRDARLGISTNGAVEDGPIVVSRVLPHSRADRIGLKPDDVIEKANGKEVRGIKELRRIVTDHPRGVVLHITRDGQEMELKEK